jgi:predicted DNA-binding transcriptional regulator AlpA
MPNRPEKSKLAKPFPKFPNEGLVRVSQIVRFLPISKCTWWNGVRSGRFPKPVKLGPNTTAWRAEDVRALAEPRTDDTPPA